MSLEYKPSLGFVETAGLVIAIQVADAMAKAAESGNHLRPQGRRAARLRHLQG